MCITYQEQSRCLYFDFLPWEWLITVCTMTCITNLLKYGKIPKISPSMYKLLQIKAPLTSNAKNPLLNRPSKYKLPGACSWKIALKYKVKQS